MKINYPSDVAQCWKEIRHWVEKCQMLQSDLNDWKLAAGEDPNLNLKLLAKNIRDLFSQTPNKPNYIYGPARFLVASAFHPNKTPSRISVFEFMQNLSFQNASCDADIKLLDIYVYSARKLLKLNGIPGEIELIWGHGYKISDDLRDWVKNYIPKNNYNPEVDFPKGELCTKL